ncbi:hypothetical protein EIP91_000370 [Steccherinum ochraceum]|uniref:GED domain-containing protein n=1 Tax=Steccherinum ochraceum TaxID=92696 RepID=A0A4R0RG74_9APHY|nr:hypothetical protein EIP91_000370 [Steccherinum ochraceum]
MFAQFRPPKEPQHSARARQRRGAKSKGEPKAAKTLSSSKQKEKRPRARFFTRYHDASKHLANRLSVIHPHRVSSLPVEVWENVIGFVSAPDIHEHGQCTPFRTNTNQTFPFIDVVKNADALFPFQLGGAQDEDDIRRRTLVSCALTCRSWLPCARFHLRYYTASQTTILRSAMDLAPVMECLLSLSPSRAAVVTELIIHPVPSTDQSWISSALVRLAPRLKRLKRLVLNGVDLTTRQSQFFKASGLLHLNELVLESVRFLRFHQLVQLLSSVQPQTMSLDGVSYADGDDDHILTGFAQLSGIHDAEKISLSLSWPVLRRTLSDWRFHIPRLSGMAFHTDWPSPPPVDGHVLMEHAAKVYTELCWRHRHNGAAPVEAELATDYLSSLTPCKSSVWFLAKLSTSDLGVPNSAPLMTAPPTQRCDPGLSQQKLAITMPESTILQDVAEDTAAGCTLIACSVPPPLRAWSGSCWTYKIPGIFLLVTSKVVFKITSWTSSLSAFEKVVCKSLHVTMGIACITDTLMLGVAENMAGLGISSSDYARRTGKMINLITELRALGADADFDLPRIAVVGNQSAGKSSVVEAISGITVPRASGTCTRCPMECRLKYHDGPWQCEIRLRKIGHDASIKSGSKEQNFGPLITDKDDLEEMIRRAQLAILNPDVPDVFFESFETSLLQPGQLPPGSSRQLAFSSDVVCLDISGPDVTDLAFIDLPGIISNVAPGEDRAMIDVVKNMVKTHIANENTLVLLTITMRDDIDNQGAADLARLADPTGSRTIGENSIFIRGEHGSWLRILDGARHPLKMGYFVTKQPSPEELEEGLSFHTAREREAAFFTDNAPWNERADLRERYGTTNLTKELSKLLGIVISKALPGLREKCKESLRLAKSDLEKFPPPASDQPAAELLRLITGFSTNVECLVRGSDNFEHLLQRCRPAYATFKRDVRGTSPDLRPFKDLEAEMFGNGLDSDERYEILEEANDAYDATSLGRSSPLYLCDVKDHIEGSLTRELPYNVPFKAKVSLIRKFSESWSFSSSRCLVTIHEATTGALRQLVSSHFGKFELTGLLDMIQAIVESQVEKSRSQTQDRVEWMLDLEDPPFTLNDHYFSTYRDRYLAKYREAWRNGLNLHSEGVQTALSHLVGAASDFQGLKVEDFAKLLGPDLYEEELIVMAETAAYFHVSYKRIIDNIPRIIDHDFLHAIMKELQERLISELGLGTDHATERAAGYLAEDEHVAMDRQLLQRKKERLEDVQKKFWGFGG